MPRKLTPADCDDLGRDYVACGLTVEQIARKYSITATTVATLVREMGLRPRNQQPWRRTVDIAELVSEYLAGASLKTLAKRHKLDRTSIKRRLVTEGVEIRDARVQMQMVADARSPEERRRNALAANKAARGRKAKPSERAKRALTVEGLGWDAGTVGQNDIDLGALLTARNVEVRPQVACGPYNIDLAVGDHVAVEIHGGGWHSRDERTSRERERLEHLLDAGWHMLIVYAPARWPVTGFTADHVIAFVEGTSGGPTARREYRVVRSDGKLIASGEAEGDDLPLPPAASGGVSPR